MMSDRTIRLPLYARLSLWLIAISLLWIILMYMAQLLIPLAFSLLFALLLHPLCVQLEKWRIPRVAAIFICLVVMLVLVTGVLLMIVSQLSDFADILPDLQKRGQELFNNLQAWIGREFGVRKSAQMSWIQKNAQSFSATGGALITGLLSTISNAFATLGLVPVYIFFLLYYRNFFKTFLCKLFTSTDEIYIHSVLMKVRDVVRNYLIGLLFVMSIIATLNTLGLLMLGIEHALFFGVLAAMLNVIPYIGIVIGSLLPILIAILTKDSIWYAVGVATIFFVVQFLEGNFITPKIVGSKVSVNALATVIALVLGGMLWGAAGMVLAIPFTAILKVMFDTIPSMQPFGYLLGAVPEEHLISQAIVQKIEEKIEEIVEKVDDL